LGAQAIVKATGEINGWIGGGCVQSYARAAALRCITSAAPQRLRLSNSQDPSEAIDVRPMACASNGEVELFIQPIAVAPRLRIYGDTPIAQMVGRLAREVDFEPLTDEEAVNADVLTQGRETYALIATQGDGDEAALEAALSSSARAVFVIASRRKAERLRNAMALRGIDQERLDSVVAPAGPDIGAVTPNEIALAAMAGLVALRRGCRDASGHPADTSVPRSEQRATGYVNPVCGAVIDPERALSSLTMANQTHYFCCHGCRAEFERNPEKYLQIALHMRKPTEAMQE
jgi:xanthine dehydrogenase accessory factor